MARQQIKDYIFTPGGAGVGTVKISGNYEQSDILTILNATDQTFIYNFADPTLGGAAVWSSAYDSDFPQTQDGVTTITLTSSTSTMSSTDSLAIYVENEAQYIRPWPFGTDAVERMRVANPQSLIDADFEYGLQNTKWQSLFLNNDIPSLYELPGSEMTINTNGYVSLIGADPISTNSDTSVTFSNPTGVVAPQWANNDYALIVNQGSTNNTTYFTADATSSNQRNLTVANTAAFSAGDTIVMVQLPGANTTTVSTGITSGATTTLAVNSGGGIATGTHVLVQTNTANLWELMTVDAGGGTTSLTVARRRLGTNSGNVNINSGNAVRLVSNVELAQIYGIDSSTSMSVNRAWMNTSGVSNMIAGSVIQKVALENNTASGTTVEIVKVTSASNSVNGTQTISRGALGTTAISAAEEGGLAIRLTGIYQAGTANVNQAGINITSHGISAGGFISTTNHNNSNSEGIYEVQVSETNTVIYYPRRSTGHPLGYPLNRYDTQVRKAAAFTGATIPVSTIVSDGGTPSTITVTTPYAHGLSPGTPIIVSLNSGTNQAYGEGSFTVLSIPSTTTFTYQGKAGAAVSGSLAGSIYVRPSAFFIHRPFDGGVLLGSGTPHHGAMAARQSKKYFRYQSGKGLVWTSGTLLSTNFDVVTISADGTATNSNITVTTDNEHYLQAGANVIVKGVVTSGYENFYTVSSISGDNSFVVLAKGTLGNATPILAEQPKIEVANWHGGSVRAGIFDDQNGAFWENTGTKVNVVLRAATFQLCGFVSVEVGSNLLTGDGTCRFLEQLVQYDKVVVRGMTHTVTGITDNNSITVSPPWRGVSNQTRVKMGKIIEKRVPQEQFNIDRIDGTGPSGFKLDNTKMQMLLIQYTWYGAGFVEFGIRGPMGNFIMCHRIMNNNVNNEAYMRSGNLPVRYSANNDSARSKLASQLSAGATTMTLIDASQFPPATVSNPAYVQVENEVIKYSGIDYATNELQYLTRGATFTLWQDGSSKSFTMGSDTTHLAGRGVTLLSCTSAPTLNHWGSAVIMDGNFDEDRGYSFTYSVGGFAMPATVGGVKTAFLMRLTPSVSNTIIGDLGTRDLINRAQLILNDMVINYTGASGRFLIEGILNPTNISTTASTWINLNSSTNGFQPSFTQFASTVSYSSGTSATGGERLFAIPVNSTNSGQLDLRRVKQLVTSAIPGTGVYPDGPEVLAINVTSYTAVSANAEIQISFTESQA